MTNKNFCGRLNLAGWLYLSAGFFSAIKIFARSDEKKGFNGDRSADLI